jgi:hypothetical protein
MPAVIYQASDLTSTKRREFLDDAKAGRALLRDTDGVSIVALPAAEFEALEALAEWSNEYQRLTGLLAGRKKLTVRDLGKLAWLRSFDRDDQLEFVAELQDALILTTATRTPGELMSVIDAWRRTAAELEDPARRSVLMGRFDHRDFVDAGEDLVAVK